MKPLAWVFSLASIALCLGADPADAAPCTGPSSRWAGQEMELRTALHGTAGSLEEVAEYEPPPQRLVETIEALARLLENQQRWFEAEAYIRQIQGLYLPSSPRAVAIDGLSYGDWLVRNLEQQGRPEAADIERVRQSDLRSRLNASDPIN